MFRSAQLERAASDRLDHKAFDAAALVGPIGDGRKIGEGDRQRLIFLGSAEGRNLGEGGGCIGGQEIGGAADQRCQAIAEAQLQAGAAQSRCLVAGSLELGIDLGGGAHELQARGLAVAIADAREHGVAGWIADGEREGLGAAAGVGIADREEAQAFAKPGRDRAGRTAGGVGQNGIAD